MLEQVNVQKEMKAPFYYWLGYQIRIETNFKKGISYIEDFKNSRHT